MVMICVSLVLRNGEHLFMCLLVICMSSKEKCLVRFSTHLKNWNVCFLLVSCMSSLHLLNVNHLSHIRFADIFSHSVYSHSVLLMASLHVQKLLHLMQSHLLTFVFFVFFFHLWSQSCITITKTNVSEVTTYVSSKNFLVSCLTLKFLIHFEQIFVYGVRLWSSFILHMAVQLSQCHLLKRIFFLWMLFTSWL